MTTNTASGLPYPDPTDALADVDLAIKALAQAVAGDTVTSTAGFTASAGWTLGQLRIRKLLGNSLVHVDMFATRTGAALTPSANGNLVDTPVATFPATWRPARVQRHLVGSNSSLGQYMLEVETSGVVSVLAGPATLPIATNDQLRLQGVYSLD